MNVIYVDTTVQPQHTSPESLQLDVMFSRIKALPKTP
jgi:hypothetical protein